MVIGGLLGALAPLVLPGPGALGAAVGLIARGARRRASTPRSRPGERCGTACRSLISSLLLSYPAMGVTSYLVRFPLRDTSTGLPQTLMIPRGRAPLRAHRPAQRRLSRSSRRSRSPSSSSTGGRAPATNCGCAGKNSAFAGYGGVRLGRQAILTLFAERRDRRPCRRDPRARLAVPLHRRGAADARLYVVRAHGGAARGRRAGRSDRRRPLLRRAADRRLRHAARDFGSARADSRPASFVILFLAMRQGLRRRM